MNKTRALELLGGSVATAADAIGISSAAVSQWPDDLPSRILDRVIASFPKRGLEVPAELLNEQAPTEAKAGA